MSRLGLWGWRGFGALVLLFMVMPIVLVVLFSFGESAMTNFPMGGLTLKWYRELFTAREFWNAFSNSMIIAAVVAVVSTVVGTLAALALARLRPKPAAAWLVALCLPVMMPPLVVGVALLVWFVRVLGLDLSLVTVILGHLLVTQPFVVLIVYARLATFDWAVIDSARDLGATPWQVFWTVTLPIVRATVIGATLIALAISLDEFIITFFNMGGGNTLPTFVFGKIRTTLDPTINAIATILIVLTVGSTVLALRLSRYRG